MQIPDNKQKLAYKKKEYDIMEAEGICLINSKQIKNSECLLKERSKGL